MRIHTDKITRQDLWANLPNGCDLEVTTHGSRKRDHAFEVKMSAEVGTDAHGIKRCYSRNSGMYGAQDGPLYGDGFTRAATYIEWGDWMVALFILDPDAIIGPYDGADDFVARTQEQVSWRQKREHAQEHADRWSATLFYTIDTPLADGLRADIIDQDGQGTMGPIVVKERTV